ncbi:MAG: hypothetical protein ABIV50_07340, partial [Opitutus sp.]
MPTSAAFPERRNVGELSVARLPVQPQNWAGGLASIWANVRPAFAISVLSLAVAHGAATARVLDLISFTPPPAWNVEEKGSGLTQHVVLSRTSATSYCMVVIYASMPASADLNASFAAEWKSVALQSIDPTPAPAPERRMVGDAPAVIGGAPATIKGQPALAMLAVLDAGTSVVSLLILTPSVEAFDFYNAEVQALFASIAVRRVNLASVAPPPPAGGPLVIPSLTRKYVIADLAGEWGLKDGINTTYVYRSSGAYAGTDSLHFSEKWTITAQGKISLEFFGIRNGKKVVENSTGVVTLSDAGILSIRMSNEQRYVLRGWLDTPRMTVMTLNGPWYETIPPEILSNPQQGGNLD